MFTSLLGPGSVHFIAGTSHCKNICQMGLGDTWLLGPGKVHSIAGTSPCKNLSQRGLQDTWFASLLVNFSVSGRSMVSALQHSMKLVILL